MAGDTPRERLLAYHEHIAGGMRRYSMLMRLFAEKIKFKKPAEAAA